MFWSADFLGQGANASDAYLPPELICKQWRTQYSVRDL